MNGCGKSDSPIVPVKPSNKCCGALQCAERVEERGLTKGNLFSETSSGHKAGEGSDMVNLNPAKPDIDVFHRCRTRHIFRSTISFK